MRVGAPWYDASKPALSENCGPRRRTTRKDSALRARARNSHLDASRGSVPLAFPPNPPPEWFVVDLFENANQAGASRTEVAAALTSALDRGTFKRERLREMAERYGTKATQALVEASISSPGTVDSPIRTRARPWGTLSEASHGNYYKKWRRRESKA